MAGTSRSDDDAPVPEGGGAAERLREFIAARRDPEGDDDTGDADIPGGETQDAVDGDVKGPDETGAQPS